MRGNENVQIYKMKDQRSGQSFLCLSSSFSHSIFKKDSETSLLLLSTTLAKASSGLMFLGVWLCCSEITFLPETLDPEISEVNQKVLED